MSLCTLAEVKTFLQESSTDLDAVLTPLIDRATKQIGNFTSREFETATATREFWYHGGGALDLAPYDLRSITTIQIDTESSSPTTLVADTDYFLYPKPAKDGVYQWIELPNHDTCTRREVTINGAWGFAAVPEDVKHWAIVTVVAWFRKDAAAFSSSYDETTGFIERPEALPIAAARGLSHYRRVASG